MPVKAMEVVEVRDHPNADALRVYDFAGPTRGDTRPTLTVVANLENVYQPGDVVAVAMIGAVLEDGTKIRKAKLRGVGSFGMALGKVDAEVGTDLTSDYCRPEYTPNLSARHVMWPSIELLHNVVTGMAKRREHLGDEFVAPVVGYQGKVKLHGTNAAVQIVGGDVVAQNRKCILDKGHYGFHEWVQQNRELFLAAELPEQHLTIFGEWCGPGIQNNVAITKIDRKVFAVFGAQIGLDQDAVMEVRPDELRKLAPEHPDIFVLPWYPQTVTLDFSDDAGRQRKEAVELLNAYTSNVEREDPWVKDTFGISGMGEGLVWYPVPGTELPWYCPRHEMMFKTKGQKHSAVKQKKPVQLDPEVVAGIEGFVEMFVTENRLQQILGETLGDKTPTRKDTGPFLKAFNADVQKESGDELEASGLAWGQVEKAVSTKARGWFFERCDQAMF